MLAAHRDQENLVHGPSKQPKTPGARYAKTPGKFNQNEENAAILVKKDGLGGKLVGDGVVTPMGRYQDHSSFNIR